MNYAHENMGFYQRPFSNGQPSFANSPISPNMIGSFPPRGLPPRGFPRRGEPFTRPTFGEVPSFQEGMRPPRYMINRARPSWRQFGRDHNQFEGTYQPMDLAKPWVTELIKSEFAKKEELLMKAKSTKLQEDWAVFREQRNKCTKMYHSSQKEFYNHQEHEYINSNEASNASDEIFTENRGKDLQSPSGQVTTLECSTCDRTFSSETAFNKHMSEHRICGADGCTPSNGMKEFNSQESIAKWIEERRLTYPSRENNNKKHQQQEELWKKGIKIGERKNKFGRDKKRFVREDRQTYLDKREAFFQKKEAKKDKFIKKLQPKMVIDEKLDWNKNLPPFKGISKLFQDGLEESFHISDEEDECIRRPTKIKDLVKTNSSLAALMSYGYDYSDEEEDKKKLEIEKPSTLEIMESMKAGNNSDDEGPLEVKTEKTTEPTLIDKKDEPVKRNSKKRPKKNNTIVNKEVNKFPYELKYRKISLLERILDKDIRKERNIILQCVKHTVANDFYMK